LLGSTPEEFNDLQTMLSKREYFGIEPRCQTFLSNCKDISFGSSICLDKKQRNICRIMEWKDYYTVMFKMREEGI
jgi:hypothetical protein